MLVILESSWPYELGVTSEKKTSATFGGSYSFQYKCTKYIWTAQTFTEAKLWLNQTVAYDNLKTVPENLFFQIWYGLNKSSAEFLNRGSSFLLPDFIFLPWCPFLHWPDYLYVSPLLHSCSSWWMRGVTGRSIQLQSLQLQVLPANLPVQQMNTGAWYCWGA